MFRVKLVISLLSICILLNTPRAHSLDVSTHERINQGISAQSFGEFSLDSYLKINLGFMGGRDQKIDGQEAYKWIKDGGRYEDDPPWVIPYRRSLNHFYNPITKEGFSGYFKGKLLSGTSLVVWAQLPIATQSPGGCYSWRDVRDYYYQALTSMDKKNQEKLYAQTFRGVGQLMHLVQDSSVPAHTRQDVHLILDYENWVKNNLAIIKLDPVFYDKSILSRQNSRLPIENIFDSSQYDGTTPQVTAGNAIGLAEYTSANFFSEDTIQYTQIRYPKLDSTEIVERSYLSILGDPYLRKYYLKNCCGETNSGKGYLLSAIDYFDYWRRKFKPLDIFPIIPVLDDNVYKEYASLLLPRAVGYSAGLLEYFFRGNLQVTAIPLIYQNRLDYVMLKIKNITPDEDMLNGTFALTYRYTPPGGPADGSADIFGQALNYDGSSTIPCTLLKSGDKDGVEVGFRLFPNYIPLESLNSLKFTLAFQGKLGKEEGAVIGKVFSPWEIKFNEDWDRDLTGNYPWAHTGVNLLENPDNGSTFNVIAGDILIKDNIRFLGEKEARVNESFVSNLCCSGKYKPEGFPIRVTPNTYVMFKIDALTINQITPAPPGTTTQWQGLWMYFDNGLTLEFTQEGQGKPYRPNLAGYTFSLGAPIYGNIYELFQIAGIPIPADPFYLQSIDFGQQLWDLGELSSTAEYWQHMEVDYIRIVEAKEQ